MCGGGGFQKSCLSGCFARLLLLHLRKIQGEVCAVTSHHSFLLFRYLLPASAVESANVNKNSR